MNEVSHAGSGQISSDNRDLPTELQKLRDRIWLLSFLVAGLILWTFLLGRAHDARLSELEIRAAREQSLNQQLPGEVRQGQR